MRSKLSAMTAFTPSSIVPFAAQSRELPVPYSLPAMTTSGVPLPVALKRIGWTEVEIAELDTVRQQEAEVAMQREVTMLTAGQMAGDEEEAA